MSSAHTLFEVSWEVCNKVGGIHTVVSTKAKTLVERYGDDYVAIGPWLLNRRETEESFAAEPGFEGFAERCRDIGVPVRVGRWRIPGSPRTILVESSGLYAKKNDIQARLWERFKVDSLDAGWDYDEPVVFGHAAALVIERWCQEFAARTSDVAVAQFHEWMTGSGLLYLRDKLPAVGTVFTTHATVVGRALAGSGRQPLDGIDGKPPAQLADELGVRSKHSMEATCAREADVFTTVSEITAREAEKLLGRRPEPLLPNGIDLAVIDELAGGVSRDAARHAVFDLAHRVLGEPCGDAALLMLSGRYEFHNKGIDLLLEAAAELQRAPGRKIVLLLTVPAGQSGVCQSVRRRLEEPLESIDAPLGIATHNLIDRERDPIQLAAARLGLDNARGKRVKLIQIPIYLGRTDDLLGLPYEAVLRAPDLTVFPSFYEPWGYTPEESLAVGVPTVTTDCAGFGLWAREQKLSPEDGVYVLERAHAPEAESARALARLIEHFLAEGIGRPDVESVCRRTAQRTAWSDLIAGYYAAFERALGAARVRADEQPTARFRPQVSVPVAKPAEGKRPRLFPFEVSATLPPPLAGLARLAHNYGWSWDPEAAGLFAEISPVSWAACGHNPVVFLRLVFPEDLVAKAADAGFVERLGRVLARFDRYMAAADALRARSGITAGAVIAYFCAEFGLHESLKVYSGGLGILAGDHLKSSSDLGLPMVGVGLYYKHGYLRQRVTATGEQIALVAENDPRNLAVELARDARGEPIEISLELPSSRLVLRAWRAHVGRVDLYLLDADVESNRPEDRAITAELYGGDHEHRLRQEIVLGRGGVRLLAALGLAPAAWHINEGHAAFLAIERVSALVRDGLTFDEARELVRATTVFTTHTPVPAGHDRFGEELMRRYFSDAEVSLGLTWERFMALGQSEEDKGAFNMTYLALSFAGFANGVSRLHGEVSKDLFRPYFPRLLKGEVPVHCVTNGVHLASWTHPAIARLLDVGDRAVRGSDFAERARAIPPEELWRVRCELKRELLARAEQNLEKCFYERHDSPLVLAKMLAGLDERALYVGFARRFAPYKRATLLFRDLARLEGLLAREDAPLRILFAGKAHPKDTLGQEVLKSVVELTRREPFLGRVFFLEDYDVDLARALVQGVDVWLNNPIRTLEASGTSGMKAAANGVLNLSVPDGWWVEAADGVNGWSIGESRSYPDAAQQDEIDGASIVQLLADEIVPLYFERDERGLPRAWIQRALACLETIPPQFSSDRMVLEYRDRAYAPMAARAALLAANGRAELRKLAAERARVRRGFADIAILEAKVSDLTGLKVGDLVDARVRVDLKALAPGDVAVELVLGHTKGTEAGAPPTDLRNAIVVALAPGAKPDGTVHTFRGAQRIARSGVFAYGIRVRAGGDAPFEAGLGDLVVWA